MQKVLPLALALLTVALAGCSDDAPSGQFSFQNHAVTVTGTAETEYIAFSDPVGGQIPDPTGTGTGTGCAQNQVPGADDQHCTQAQTRILLTFTELPDPQGKTYSAYLVDSTGTDADKSLGTLTAEADGSYTLNFTEDDDYSNDETYSFDTLEVRLDAPTAILVGTASSAAGSQTFELNEDLVSGVDFTGTWTGKKLTVSVSGLNNTLAYEGWLVGAGGDHTESFPVANGETEYEAEANIDTFEAFHIHVAGTKVNVGVGSIA